MQHIFWKKCSLSYLSLLQERFKWKAKSKPICNDAVVLLRDENSPLLKWIEIITEKKQYTIGSYDLWSHKTSRY